MVVSILFLTASLILTFGKSSTRFFDRLNISFAFSIIMQFVFLVIAILPHIRLNSKMEIVHLIAYLLVIVTAAIYFTYNHTKISYINLIFTVLIGVIVLTLALIVLSHIIYYEYFISIMLAILLFAVVFAVANSFQVAFLGILISFFILVIIALFSPIYDNITLTSIHVTLIDLLVPCLFITMFMFNVFKRERKLE